MPLLTSGFKTKGLFKNTHFSTIYSAKIRRVFGVQQERERFELSDGDFIDVDWSFPLSRKQTNKVALLFHGLEGDAQRTYMLAMAKLLNRNGYDVAAVNFRGCSGSGNKMYRSYHSGETEDIRFIVQTIALRNSYKNLFLYGVSLGGNALLKYLGENKDIPASLKAVSTIGVPIDLKASLEQLTNKENFVYRTSFLIDLKRKYRKKMHYFPDQMSQDAYKKIHSLKDFDDLYTAPAHGFENALDYYVKASSFQYLSKITIPTFILNAKNDSFLHGDCYPYGIAGNNRCLFLETPKHGGHVGFYLPGEFYYNEQKTLEFFEEYME
ncbi:alpha/beta fold hydrolase [Dokdonia sp.]|uniref:YheT family hydrolase n=1 Tax=Dokdonia sp. TaxID=2024995 RepID=UPI0032640F7B